MILIDRRNGRMAKLFLMISRYFIQCLLFISHIANIGAQNRFTLFIQNTQFIDNFTGIQIYFVFGKNNLKEMTSKIIYFTKHK